MSAFRFLIDFIFGMLAAVWSSSCYASAGHDSAGWRELFIYLFLIEFLIGPFTLKCYNL